MTNDPLHLRVGCVPGNQNKVSLCGLLRHNFMDPGNKGTGSIDQGIPLFGDLLIDLPAHPVGADHHPLSRLQLLHGADDPGALGDHVVYHVRIVNDGPQGCHPPFSNSAYTSFTARSTPKQKPAVLATVICTIRPPYSCTGSAGGKGGSSTSPLISVMIRFFRAASSLGLGSSPSASSAA